MVRDEADDLWAHHRRSVFLSALLEVRGGGGVWIRTVQPLPANGPPGPCGQSAWHLADNLSLSLLELCFRFGLSCGLFLGLVGPL
jgi:hypothetical protein